MTLTELVRAVRAVRAADDPRAAARELIPAMDAVLTDRVADETVASLWLQLARAATGQTVVLLEDPADREGARAACLAALDPPRRGRGRPSKGPRQRFDLWLPLALAAEIDAAARAAGISATAEIERRCRATT